MRGLIDKRGDADGLQDIPEGVHVAGAEGEGSETGMISLRATRRVAEVVRRVLST